MNDAEDTSVEGQASTGITTRIKSEYGVVNEE
jgi:hypothetical protein